MIPPMLPNEIRDLIIELLIDHPNMLKDCRLVSKSWNQRAQQLLFRNFDAEINVGSGLDVCVSRALLDLLESPYSTLKNNIRNLSIIGVAKFWVISQDRLGTDSEEGFGFSPKCYAVQLLDEFLPRILALRLSEVEHFRLENIYWTKFSQLKSILSSFAEVTTMTWRSVATEDAETSRDVLLGLFNQTNLNQLILSNVHLHQNSTSPLMPLPLNPLQLSSITTLEITVEETVLPVLNAFVTVPPRIRNLTLEMTEKSASHSTDVGNLLHHLGDVLLSLMLAGPQRHSDTSHHSIPPTRTMAISLSNNHALECLTFKGFLFHSAHPIPTSANQGMILDLLETIKAFTLKEVTISASLTGEDASSDFAGIFDTPTRITPAPHHTHRFRFSLTGGTKNTQPYYRQLIVSNMTHAGVELWKQGRLACDLNGEELLLVKSTMVNEVVVDDEGMTCTNWPHSETPAGPFPGEEDEL